MNTDATGHEHWDELAAGSALHALEPEEEAAFRAHLDGCSRCRQVMDENAFVAAQLGALSEVSEEAPPSWSSIRAGIVGTVTPSGTADTSPPARHPTDGPAPVVSLSAGRRRRHTASRLLGAAAAAVLLAGAGTAAWQLSNHTTGPGRPAAAVSRCAQTPGCHVVRLPQGDPEAVVLAEAGRARVVPTGLSAAGAGHAYALWQMPRDGRPVLVTVLPSTRDGVPGPAADLALPYAETAAFAISLEPVDVVPTAPTHVVAVGTATD